jgi:hypothetical protein
MLVKKTVYELSRVNMYTIWMIVDLKTGSEKVIHEFKKKYYCKLPKNKIKRPKSE